MAVRHHGITRADVKLYEVVTFKQKLLQLLIPAKVTAPILPPALPPRVTKNALKTTIRHLLSLLQQPEPDAQFRYFLLWAQIDVGKACWHVGKVVKVLAANRSDGFTHDAKIGARARGGVRGMNLSAAMFTEGK
eukprot:260085-Pleurochrysis_carterae.AAC.1